MLQKEPSPQTTLAILLGASQWPHSPEFQDSEAFAHSVQQLKAYLLNPYQFGLPTENMLDLFDVDQSADDIDVAICNFLDQRCKQMKIAGNAARDLLVYYVGHGGFVGIEQDYYLAIRRTRSKNPQASSIGVASLAYTLKEQARHLRRFVILDCCFAAAAFHSFQSNLGQVALLKSIDAFEEKRKGVGYPERGTALLCSSGPKIPSLIANDGSQTLFTTALLQALVIGNLRQQNKSHMSLRELTSLITDVLTNSSKKNAPRPHLHSPDQSEGDIADIPFFPNLISTPSRYKKWWSISQPGYVIILLDQSNRVVHQSGFSHTKARKKLSDMSSEAVNEFLNSLIASHALVMPDGTCQVRSEVEVTVLGYGGGEVSSLLFYTQAKKDIVTLSELAEFPLYTEIRQHREMDDSGKFYTIQVPYPIWIEPKAVGNAPMCKALWKAKEYAEQWSSKHPESYPPIVIHITGGSSDDGNPLTPALQLCQIRTADGRTLLYNSLISSSLDAPIIYPSREDELPNVYLVRELFKMSSIIPERESQRLESFMERSIPKGARGFFLNSSFIDIYLPFPRWD